MARKASPQKTAASVKSKPKTRTTAVRNTAVPRLKSQPKREITHAEIAVRAYEIHLSGAGGSEQDNWHRAERELRGL